MSSYLSKEELIRKLGVCSGLIPIDLDGEKQELIWRDLGQFHNYEGFFRTSLATFSQLRALGNQNETEELYRTDLDVLDSDEILTENIYPTAFIFHAGRCGSTLLSKSLARSRANLVFGEAQLHNQIWSVFTDDWKSPPEFNEEQKRRYRHLILAMGRRRLATHKNHIIKFTSTNILLFDLIRSAVPDVPAIFVYRSPAAILRSFLNKPPGWSASRWSRLKAFVAGVGSDLSEPELYSRAVARFFTAALKAKQPGLRFLNYERLSAAHLPTILAACNITVEPEELVQMQDQFEYDSKTEYKLKTHEKPKVAHDLTVIEELCDLYQRLVNSDKNI